MGVRCFPSKICCSCCSYWIWYAAAFLILWLTAADNCFGFSCWLFSNCFIGWCISCDNYLCDCWCWVDLLFESSILLLECFEGSCCNCTVKDFKRCLGQSNFVSSFADSDTRGATAVATITTFSPSVPLDSFCFSFFFVSIEVIHYIISCRFTLFFFSSLSLHFRFLFVDF